jgi:hypothetical protein
LINPAAIGWLAARASLRENCSNPFRSGAFFPHKGARIANLGVRGSLFLMLILLMLLMLIKDGRNESVDK